MMLAGCGAVGPFCARSAVGGERCFDEEPQRDAYVAESQQRASKAEVRKSRRDEERAEAERDGAAMLKENQQRADQAERDRIEHDAALARQLEKEQVAAQAKEALRSRSLLAASEPAWVLTVLSARICEQQAEIAGLNADLKRERQIEAASGVRDRRELRDIGVKRVDAEAAIKELRADMKKRFSVAVKACSDPKVEALLGCQTGVACEFEDLDLRVLWEKAR